MSKHQHHVDPIIGDAVGSQLRSLYDDFASEAVPDRFVALIEQLEKLEEIEALATERENKETATDGSKEQGDTR